MTEPSDQPSDSQAMRAHVNRGLAWLGAARGVISAFDLVLTVVILALWISPTEYGIAMLAGSLFQVLDLATDLGLSAAVIQRDDHTDERMSTVFWLNVALSLVMCGGLAVGGPLLGDLQRHREVGWILMAYGGKLVAQNVYFVPQALMRKQLRFKELSLIRMSANAAEFAGKMVAAALGAGIWFHLIGRACHTVVTGIGVQLRQPWRPRLVLRLRDSKQYISFGLKSSASQILFQLYTNLDYQVVGYYFGAAANGLYHLAYTLVLEPVRLVSHVVMDIAFPTFAKLKHQRERLIDQLIAFTRLNLITVMPIMVAILLVADELIGVFWGHKWLPAAPAAKLLAWVGVLRALSFVVPPLLDGMGRPTLSLAYTSVAAVATTSGYIIAARVFGEQLGFLSVAWAWLIGYPIAFTVLFAIALSVLELSPLDYLRRIGSVLVAIGLAGGLALGARVATASLPAWARLAIVLAVLLAGCALLLSRIAGIGPRALKRAMSG